MKSHIQRPLLRWAGSKKQLLPILRAYWSPEYKRYVEPFAGSACLFFSIRPGRALLGDLNCDLMRMYACLKKDPDPVIHALANLPKGKDHYKRIRDADGSGQSEVAQCARFIYLNRYCFNGLYRTNRLGKFNVPYGGEKSGSLPSPKQLRGCASLLRRARLVRGDFATTLQGVVAGDFVYLDPPFSVAARRTFNEYNATVFSDGDVRRLKEWMKELVFRKVSFVVSYAECEEGIFLAMGYPTRKVSVRRHIAGSFTNRVKSNELLISHQASG